MSLRCRIFAHQRIHHLERLINEFLDETGAVVVNSTQSCDAHGNIFVVVWYEDAKAVQEPVEEVL